jgi:hypothetical protein
MSTLLGSDEAWTKAWGYDVSSESVVDDGGNIDAWKQRAALYRTEVPRHAFFVP